MDEEDLIEAPAEYSSRSRSGRAAALVGGVRKAPSEFDQRRTLSNDAWRKERDQAGLELRNDARLVARQSAQLAERKAQAELTKTAYDQYMEEEEWRQVTSALKGLSKLDYKDPDAPAKRDTIASDYALAGRNPWVQQAFKDHEDRHKTFFGNKREDDMGTAARTEAEKNDLKVQQVDVGPPGARVQMGKKEELLEKKMTKEQQDELDKDKAELAGYEKGLKDLDERAKDPNFNPEPFVKDRIRLEIKAEETRARVQAREPAVGNVVQPQPGMRAAIGDSKETDKAADEPDFYSQLAAERAKHKSGTFTFSGKTYRIK